MGLGEISTYGSLLLKLIDLMDKYAPNLISDFVLRKRKYGFKYRRFIKKHAIYPDGHGIVINTMEIEAFNEIKQIKRFFDVSDGCKSIKLPSLKDMIGIDEKKRFVENGFWYKSSKHVNIEIEEGGDTDLAKKFIFIFDPPIKPGETVVLSYAFSIICMYPIDRDGKLSPQKAHQNHVPRVNFSIRHPIDLFECEIAFRGIDVAETPMLHICKGDSEKVVAQKEPEVFFDPFYGRYRFTLKNPSVGDKIRIQWKWKT